VANSRFASLSDRLFRVIRVPDSHNPAKLYY